MKPVVSCSPNSNITLPFEDYIGAIIPKCDEGAKKRTNEVLVETYRQAALPLNCHNPRKKQEGKKYLICREAKIKIRSNFSSETKQEENGMKHLKC